MKLNCHNPILLFWQLKKKEFEDTKWAVSIHKSRKDRQLKGHTKKDKRTNNDLQNTTQKTKASSTHPTKTV